MNQKYIKLSELASIMGLHYRTVVRHFKEGKIEGYTDSNGRMYALNPAWKDEVKEDLSSKVILYARVSSTVNKASLDGQIERMRAYASAKGYQIVGEYKEIASGLNDNRPKLNSVLKRNDYGILLSEHKDRLTRFGFGYISLLLNEKHVKVEVINTTENKDQEIVDDFVSIITSFCGKIYGAKRKEKTQRIIEEVSSEKEER